MIWNYKDNLTKLMLCLLTKYESGSDVVLYLTALHDNDHYWLLREREEKRKYEEEWWYTIVAMEMEPSIIGLEEGDYKLWDPRFEPMKIWIPHKDLDLNKLFRSLNLAALLFHNIN